MIDIKIFLIGLLFFYIVGKISDYICNKFLHKKIKKYE